MIKFLLFVLLTLPATVLACPACAGGNPGADVNKPPYTLIILSIFIILTYIPFYFLFRAAKKYDPHNKINEHS